MKHVKEASPSYEHMEMIAFVYVEEDFEENRFSKQCHHSGYHSTIITLVPCYLPLPHLLPSQQLYEFLPLDFYFQGKIGPLMRGDKRKQSGKTYLLDCLV